MIEKVRHKDPTIEKIIDQLNGWLCWRRVIAKMSGHRPNTEDKSVRTFSASPFLSLQIEDKPMIPQLRGMVVTTTTEGAQTYTYVNVTFIVPASDAASVDLARAFEDLAGMVRTGKVKERPVALRREFIQPVP